MKSLLTHVTKRHKKIFFILIGSCFLGEPLAASSLNQEEEDRHWLKNGRLKDERLWEILPSNSLKKQESDNFLSTFFPILIERASDDQESQVDLGACYYYGKGTPVKDELAFYWLSQAELLEDGRGLGLLGLCYAFGRGCLTDDETAHSLFIKGAQKGNAEALNMLGLSSQYGLRKQRNILQAFEYFKVASEKNYPQAQTNLGFFYMEGLGTSQDITKAITLYKAAARQDDPGAQNNLANCYEEGKGCQINMMKAFHLYRQSAKQGDHAGQYNLGCFYLSGKGSIPANRSKGVKYMKKSAAQNNKRAQATLIDLKEAPMTEEFQRLLEIKPFIDLFSMLGVFAPK